MSQNRIGIGPEGLMYYINKPYHDFRHYTSIPLPIRVYHQYGKFDFCDTASSNFFVRVLEHGMTITSDSDQENGRRHSLSNFRRYSCRD